MSLTQTMLSMTIYSMQECYADMAVGYAAEKQVLRDQASSSAKGGKPKPANIMEKIISGRINKVCSACMPA